MKMNSTKSRSLQKIRNWTTIACFLGLILSYYAYFVETKKVTDKNYEAMCDISEHMSCSKVFSSKYGTGFGLMEIITGQNSSFNQPNGVYGLIFYGMFFFLGNINKVFTTHIQIGLSILSNIMTVYLGYVLYFILHDFCVVCISTYVINAFLLFLSVKKFSLLRSMETAQNANKIK